MPKHFPHIFSILLFNLCFLFSAKAQTVLSPPPHHIMTLEGNYMNANMYIQNPHTDKDSGFCVIKCLVNDKEIDSINSTAFEIPLMSMGFKEGDSIKIEIYHHIDCKPKVIYNPPAPKKPVYFTDVTVDSNYVLHFKTKDEVYKYTYTIEQYRWNKWVKIGEVEGKGIYDGAEYSFQVTPHSGENQVRVKMVSVNGVTTMSKAVQFMSFFADNKPTKVCEWNKLTLTRETMYEIYDSSGNIVKKGFTDVIMFDGLESGVYYLNYDNVTTELIVKPKKK